jgi:hypothetical protein
MRTNPTILSLTAAVAWLWPAPAVAQSQIHSAPTPQMVTQAVGAVAEMDDRGIAIRSEETESVRYRYRYTNATRWVNGSGDPVSRQSVRPGARVTVHYRRGMDGPEVSRVVLHSPPAVVGRNLLSELAATVAALPPNRLPGALPEVIGPQLPEQLPQIEEGTEPEPVAEPDTGVKHRVARNTGRRTPKAIRPVIVQKKRSWLASLFAPRGP